MSDIKECSRCPRLYTQSEKNLVNVPDDLKQNDWCIECMAKQYPDEPVLKLVVALHAHTPKFFKQFEKKERAVE